MATPTIKLAQALTADHVVVTDLVRAYFEFDNLVFDERVEKAIWELLVTPALGAYYLATVDDEVIGYSALTFGFDAEAGGRLGVVTDFYLSPEARGQGFGRQMINEIILIGQQLGLNTIELAVIEGNGRAARLYSSSGFVPTKGRFWMARRL